jgi:hypothetical protein
MRMQVKLFTMSIDLDKDYRFSKATSSTRKTSDPFQRLIERQGVGSSSDCPG